MRATVPFRMISPDNAFMLIMSIKRLKAGIRFPARNHRP